MEDVKAVKIGCVYMYIVELHEAEKPIFTIIDTMCVNVPSASWTDYPI